MEHEWGWGQFNDWNSPALLGGAIDARRTLNPRNLNANYQHVTCARPSQRAICRDIAPTWFAKLGSSCRTYSDSDVTPAGASATFGV
jgi:hypothetical protein